jgi:monoamine oxidase
LTAAEELTNVGYEHVAVLVMANQSRPGGAVVSGAGAQEEDVFRRTDAHRHVLRYKDSLGYPLDTTEPTAMVIRDVTICRGPCEQGYPFLEIRPKVSLIFVAAKREPSLINEDGIRYGLEAQKCNEIADQGVVPSRYELRLL